MSLQINSFLQTHTQTRTQTKKIKSKTLRLFDKQTFSELSKKLKVVSSVPFNSPIFNIKYSKIYTNILACCTENGHLAVINTHKKPPTHSTYNNTNTSNIIPPLFNSQIHDNVIYGLNWSSFDTQILTCGGDWIGKSTDCSSDKLGETSTTFIGHNKGIKCISSNCFNNNLISSCGRDGIIFIFDKNVPNKQYCTLKCPYTNTKNNSPEPHLHPVGAFKTYNKDRPISKKKNSFCSNTAFDFFSQDDVSNTFTSVDWFTQEWLISTESNNDEIKFWDWRTMMTSELDLLFKCGNFISMSKSKKLLLGKIVKQNYIGAISPFTHLFTRYLELTNQNKLSSKFNSNNINFFGVNNSANNIKEIELNISANNWDIVTILAKSTREDNKNKANEKDAKEAQEAQDGKGDKKIAYWNSFNYENILNAEKEINFSALNYDEENELKSKIKEIKNKRFIKGWTSLNINREERKIWVNSMSNSQYIYDAYYMNSKEPIELKGHFSTFYIKSVWSPNGKFVWSGSKDSNMWIWDVATKSSHQMSGYHKGDVNAVDWGRNYKNNIASACDGGDD